MSKPVELWNQAADAFDARFKAIDKAQWSGSTPCAEWSVHELVTHATGVQISMGGALGANVAEGADWKTARAAMAEALTAPGITEGTATHPAFGEVPKAMLIGIATTDLLIHAWDLARAIGADETLPPEAVAAAYAGLQQLPAEVIRVPGRFDAAVTVPEGAGPQATMLAFAGRKV